jgi:hypothetical protein
VILFSVCNSCLQPFQVRLDVSDPPLVKQMMDENGFCPCPRLCGGKINLVQGERFTDLAKDPRLRPEMTITAKELFRAINGMGLPDEVPKDLLTLDALLRSSTITLTVGEEVGKNIYLHELHLSNGVVIHLTAGQKGAQVMKIVKSLPGVTHA